MDARPAESLPEPGTGLQEPGGVLDTIGHTPTVPLKRLAASTGLHLYGKLEALNPGGSIKDRPAAAILAEGLRTGVVTPETVIVESSSGNMGVGLAQACRYYGLRFICVVDSKAAPQNLRILRAYGAEIELVADPDPETCDLLTARLHRVEELLARYPQAYWPNQYANEANPLSHFRTTMEELVADVGRDIDYLFVATSTCGTLKGCGSFIRERGLPTKLVAVDAAGSLIFSDRPGDRWIPGIGAGMKPPLRDLSLVDEVVHVTDAECVAGCRSLVEREAILAGGSSGGIVAALHRMLPRIPTGSKCVLVLCDRGERYLDTVYDDEWVRAHCGEVPSLTLEPTET
ncbi:MAG: 2,3-diaminopropionate biosynthesis protein SbnA [bacterium]